MAKAQADGSTGFDFESVEGGPPALVDYETRELERNTYVSAIVHLYRGELSRANTWRQRLDQTTHWAIFTTASVLGFAFGRPDASHFSLPFANVLLLVLLVLEARRFRFFDVWRARIRKIERNFYAPILERRLSSPEEQWAHQVARDLGEPHFHLTRLQALRSRLLRNYLAIFGIVFVAWVIKLVLHPEPSDDIHEIIERCRIGPLPPAVALLVIAAFYGVLLVILMAGRAAHRTKGDDNWDMGEIVEEEVRLFE